MMAKPVEPVNGGETTMGGTMVSVKDAPFGAKGDGTTDDSDALQRAFDGPDRHIYFPRGRYLVTRPINFETPELNFHYEGEPGAHILGNFPDALFKRSVKSPIGGVHVVEKLIFENGHAEGKGLMIHSCVMARVVSCQFQGQCKVGIETFNSQCATLDTCTIIGIRGVGLMAGNATTALNCDITGCVEGIRHQNLGLVVLGGRYEVNGIAIHLGMNEKGEAWQSTGFKISGLSMESNDHGIYMLAAASGTVDACAITNNTPDKHSGIFMHNAEEIGVSAIGVSSGTHPFLDAGIFLNNPKHCSFGAIPINVASGKTWQLAEDMPSRGLFFAPSCNPMPEGV